MTGIPQIRYGTVFKTDDLDLNLLQLQIHYCTTYDTTVDPLTA
jgi:hypothetical protein